MGILYPPGALAPEVLNESVFTALAPFTDDIWLFWMARLAGSVVRKVGSKRAQRMWPGCDEQGLAVTCNMNGGNDIAIAALTERYGSPLSFSKATNNVVPENGEGVPLKSFINLFKWSDRSRGRNELTCRYEPLQPFLFLRLAAAAECTMVLDIGANIGVYSILSTCVSTVSAIHSFEIEKSAFAELKRNILMNRVEGKITSHFIAVSDHDGFVTFGVASPMAGNNGVIDTSIHDPDMYREERQVPSIALDNFLHESGQSVAIKIDVEGHEINVLEGCKNFLLKNKCIIQIENYDKKSHKITNFLTSIGYKNIFTMEADHYYSNNEIFFDEKNILEFVEEALSVVVQFSLKGRCDSLKQSHSGMTIF